MTLARRIESLEVGAADALRTRRRALADARLVASDPVAYHLFGIWHEAFERLQAADPLGAKGVRWRLAFMKERRASAALGFYGQRMHMLEGMRSERLHLRYCLPWDLPVERTLLEELAALPGGAEAVDLTVPENWRPGVKPPAGYPCA